MHKKKWMTIIKHRPSCMMDDDRACTPWQSHGLWHFSGLWNLFCRLHNEIILVGPFNSHYRTKFRSNKIEMACQVQFDTTYSVMSLFQRESIATMWKGGGHYVYHTVPSTKLCPKQKSMAPRAILCTVQFVIPLLLTFVLYGLKNCMFCCF